MAKESKLHTMHFGKDQRVIKDIYREGFDACEWGTCLDRFEEQEVKLGKKRIVFKGESKP